VPHVRWEEKNNILGERRWAGGKGANVARWLRRLRGKPELLVPLGGPAGDELFAYLKTAGVPCRVVPIKGDTRVNVIVTSDSGQLRFNPLGPVISRNEWKTLSTNLGAFCREQKKAHGFPLVILSGALPRGVPETAYKQMIELAHKFSIEVCLDCDGAAFAQGIKAKPFLVKPNIHELEQWWQRPVKSEADLRAAVIALSEITEGWVLLSQGSEGALLWSSQNGAGFVARAPKVHVRNTVGAGDALMAGFVREIEREMRPQRWLRWGVATGTACVQQEGGKLADAKTLDTLASQVEVEPLDW
jgi:1-phosphofructokinase family hexose kinase